MAGTYSKMNAHIVFALKHRTFAIQANWKGELNKYICGIIQGKNVKPIIANSAGDHIHILISFKPSVNISDLVRDIKNNSTNFINRRCFTQRTFSWQEGFGCFTCSHSEMKRHYTYIRDQELRHKIKGYKEEYIELLRTNDVEHEERYCSDW